jgi:hypothetical protein
MPFIRRLWRVASSEIKESLMLTGLRRQRAGERAEAVVEDERQAVDVIHLLQQIFIRRFPRLKRLTSAFPGTALM